MQQTIVEYDLSPLLKVKKYDEAWTVAFKACSHKNICQFCAHLCGAGSFHMDREVQ